MNKTTRTADKTPRHILGHNFGIVYRFEVIRTLKKPSFWLSIVAFPLLLAVIFGISFLSTASSDDIDEQLAQEQFSLAVTDDSHLVNQQLLEQLDAQIVDNKQQGIDMVQSGEIEAYFYYPADLTTNSIDVYGQNVSLFQNGKYSSVAESLLKSSVQTTSDPNVAAILSDQVNSSSHYYKDGQEYNVLSEMIVPAAFLVLFYLIICIFSNQMLASTVEEKENRITEMLLTSIQSKTLITGKIFAFITLILIQVLLIIGLIVGGYLIAAHYLDLPSIDLSFVTINPTRAIIGLALFIVSILMYSGILVAIGAAAPTAKEANSFMSVPILILLAPLYIFTTAITTPEAPAVVAMTYFPLTAPVMMMLLNTMGTLTIASAVIGLAIMAVTTIVIFIIAARLFQTRAVGYHRSARMSLRHLRRSGQ